VPLFMMGGKRNPQSGAAIWHGWRPDGTDPEALRQQSFADGQGFAAIADYQRLNGREGIRQYQPVLLCAASEAGNQLLQFVPPPAFGLQQTQAYPAGCGDGRR